MKGRTRNSIISVMGQISSYRKRFFTGSNRNTVAAPNEDSKSEEHQTFTTGDATGDRASDSLTPSRSFNNEVQSEVIANRGFADEVQFRQLIALAKSYTSAENKLALAAVKAIAALCRSSSNYRWKVLNSGILNTLLRVAEEGNAEFHYSVPRSQLLYVQDIGAGSQGQVQLFNWKGNDVAVKTYFIDLQDAMMRAEFQREVALLSLLNHRNLASVLGASVEEKFVIFEYYPVGDLYDLLHKQRVVLSWQSKLKIALDVALGMSYLHEHSIIHRDLKSCNVLIRNVKGCLEACITDFGSSRYIDRDSTMTGMHGTVNWCAPEILKSLRYDEKADVFSMGSVMYEMLTGCVPFGNKKFLEVIQLVTKGTRPLIEGKLVAAQPEWVQLIKTCWSHQPERRPGFSDIVRAIQDLLSKLVIERKALDDRSQIRTLLEADISEAVTVLTETVFQSQISWYTYALGSSFSKSSLSWLFERALKYIINVSQSCVWGYFKENTLLAVALWRPTMDAAKETKLADLVISGFIGTPFKLGLAVTGRLRSLRNYFDDFQRRICPSAFWTLELITVAPAFQNQGIGTHLLRAVLEVADKQQCPCYCLCPREEALEFLKQNGFIIQQHVNQPPLPTHWILSRQAC